MANHLAERFVSSALNLSLDQGPSGQNVKAEAASIRQLTDQLTAGVEIQKFLSEAIHLIRDQVLRTQRYADGSFPNSIYRAFDELDRVFGLDYRLDSAMPKNLSLERVYEGAGAGVQTSYITILRTFELIPAKQQARWVDLGSGFGRVGLALGLLRPDATFNGYEIITHRVDISNAAARRAGIHERIRFETQDLADPNFKIPEADVYYMWDPFTKETYQYVLQQIKEQARTREVTVVAKGAAATWMEEIMREENWAANRTHDGGNLGVFTSVAANVESCPLNLGD